MPAMPLRNPTVTLVGVARLYIVIPLRLSASSAPIQGGKDDAVDHAAERGRLAGDVWKYGAAGRVPKTQPLHVQPLGQGLDDRNGGSACARLRGVAAAIPDAAHHEYLAIGVVLPEQTFYFAHPEARICC